ncbi:2-nitropropane dioxygenase [Colletotrichum limetticola]|uniref:2-nitropropane dioxygenase n=1 Tax=Colletotrichum limetticola TaxID=1209924 RepID=A0ABQ9P929_9PEZI|nr:2-nitropropane dioxygenase [Colletotrichum limetticola]
MIMNLPRLIQAFPWVELPLVANAPMSGVARHKLATSVTLNGGLGFIGFTGVPNIMDLELRKARDIIASSTTSLPFNDMLPIGIGIIAIGAQPQAWSSVFSEHKPALAWLSFGTADQFAEWAQVIREVSPATKIWIQLGTAGGIIDGRGIAAACMLGADGVVMGTRFLGAEECELESDVQREVFAAADGGQATVRSRIWDELWGRNPWPEMYDGRCLRNTMSDDFAAGMAIEQVLELAWSNRFRKLAPFSGMYERKPSNKWKQLETESSSSYDTLR